MTTAGSPNRICSLSTEALVRNAYWKTHSNISQLDAKIDELLLRRRCLHTYRDLLSTHLSPVRFLPPELLGEIFRYCLPQDYDESGAHKAVMLPSHVCKRWRDVALSTPALWTNIFLHVTDEETLESRTALVTNWVSRSGNLPLSFTLRGRENVLPIMAVLFQHCARWQHINLSVPLETMQCLEAANGRLQRLETLGIDWCDSSSWVEQILESAPRLRKVSVNRKFLWNSGLNGSWAQLVELDASCASYSVGDCLTLLQAVGSLQTLKVNVNSEVVEGHPRLVFSHPLVSLDVCGTEARWMLFDHITLPNIRDLSVDEIEYQSVSQLIPFIRRSSSFLRRFSFRIPSAVYGAWHNKILQILEYTPSLHTLCLAYGSSYARCNETSIFEQLKCDDCLIPMLNTISIVIGNPSVIPEYQALRELILSRRSTDKTNDDLYSIMWGVEPIQKLTVQCIDCWDDTTWHEEVSQIFAPIQIVDTLQIG